MPLHIWNLAPNTNPPTVSLSVNNLLTEYKKFVRTNPNVVVCCSLKVERRFCFERRSSPERGRWWLPTTAKRMSDAGMGGRSPSTATKFKWQPEYFCSRERQMKLHLLDLPPFLQCLYIPVKWPERWQMVMDHSVEHWIIFSPQRNAESESALPPSPVCLPNGVPMYYQSPVTAYKWPDRCPFCWIVMKSFLIWLSLRYQLRFHLIHPKHFIWRTYFSEGRLSSV